MRKLTSDEEKRLLSGVIRDAYRTIDRAEALLGMPDELRRPSQMPTEVEGPDEDGYLRHRCEDGFRIYGAADRSWWHFEMTDDTGELRFCPTCGRRLRMSVEVRR